MTRDWWQTDPTYVIDDPPKGFECPPILNFVGQMTRDNGLNSWALNTVPAPDYRRLQGMCVTVVGGHFLCKEVDKGRRYGEGDLS